jgi:translation initiation factor 1
LHLASALFAVTLRDLFKLDRHCGPVALPLPEWGFAVGSADGLRRFLTLLPDQTSLLKRGLPVAKKAASFAALGGLVFSTDAGRHCPDCRQPVDACTCKTSVIPEGDGIARVRRESKGRGGKTVTTVTGVPLPEDALKELATTLKRRCGTGGALKDGVIEIQGDHVQTLLAELLKQGFKAKKSGG